MALLAPVLLAVVIGIAAMQHGSMSRARAAVLLALATVAGLFAQLTHDVVDGGGAIRIDEPITDWVIGHRVGWLNPVVRIITDSGGVAAMTAVTIVVCAGLGARRRWPAFLVVAAAGIASAVLGSVLKSAIGRARPPVVDRLVSETNASFPSGHALGSTTITGIVAALVVIGTARRSIRVVAVAVAAGFAVIIGLTRIYLGVHWTTDVVAGWALGILLIALCLTPYLWWRRGRSAGHGRHDQEYDQ
ncbi:phosphatase PAP2 family protein [Nocardia spumae]|uniref:phosphatase PAP2 family protein n=1 Tax=Nocardia spumae TaxID=2887190 RepID=UPI0027E09F1F|nr:phosphatase PAP2 family protein [Nocardia spumae]